MSKHCIFFKLIIIIFFVLPVSAQQQEDSLTAQQILDKMMSVYAKCDTYMDEGEVVTTFMLNEKSSRIVKPFSTAFVRGSNFRFEYQQQTTEGLRRYIIWQNNTDVKEWTFLKPEIIDTKSLGLALAGASGVSSESAYIAPYLLMPDLYNTNKKHYFKYLESLTLVGKERRNNKEIYKVSAVCNDPLSDLTLWIDCENFLLVQLNKTRVNTYSGYNEETKITYKPRFNIDIPTEKLSFDPPTN